MISLDLPPVPDRELPDPVALRRSTLAAARRSTGRPADRRTPRVLALVATALVAAVIFGVAQRVAPTPQVAGPVPTSGTSTGPIAGAALGTDRGPASADQVAAAARRCVSYAQLPQVEQTLFARRVDDGTGETTALILRLEGGHVFHCRPNPGTVLFGELIPIRASTDLSAVVVGGVNTSDSVSGGDILTERTAAVLSVGPQVAVVEVVTSGPGWSAQRFRAAPYDGWVYVPVVLTRRTAAPPTPGPRPGGAIPVDQAPDPHLVVTAYDADGRTLYEQQY